MRNHWNPMEYNDAAPFPGVQKRTRVCESGLAHRAQFTSDPGFLRPISTCIHAKSPTRVSRISGNVPRPDIDNRPDRHVVLSLLDGSDQRGSSMTNSSL